MGQEQMDHRWRRIFYLIPLTDCVFLQCWCLSQTLNITRPFPATCPQSRAPLPTPESSTSPRRTLLQSNYTTGSPPALFSRSSINIAWRMGTIYFTSHHYPKNWGGFASTQGKPPQILSPRDTLRWRLPISPRTHQRQILPRHWPRPIHYQQRHLTKRWRS